MYEQDGERLGQVGGVFSPTGSNDVYVVERRRGGSCCRPSTT